MQVLISFLNFFEFFGAYFFVLLCQGYAIVQIYIFPSFPGFRWALPAPLPNGNQRARALPIGARLICEKQLEIRFGRNEKENMAENTHSLKLRCGYGAEHKIDFHVVYSVTVVFLSLRVYNRAMDLIQKFSSDVEKIKKHYRAEHQTYNGEEVCNQVAAFFEQQNRDVASLAHSYASYWKEAYILPSQNMEEEPTREHIDLLAGMMALLLDVEDSWQFTECFTQQDWKQLCQLTNYEAEDLPLELLSSLMKNFVDNQAV